MDMSQQTTGNHTSKKVIFWHPDQIVVTLHSDLDASAGKKRIIESLGLDILNNALNQHNFNLKSFSASDVPHLRSSEAEKPGGSYVEIELDVIEEGVEELEELEEVIRIRVDEDKDDDDDDTDKDDEGHESHGLNNPTGKYLFSDPAGGTLATCFFHLEQIAPGPIDDSNPPTTQAVNLINFKLTKPDLPAAQLLSAMPNWLNGGTGEDVVTHGCPVNPPYPVTDSACSSGTWKISLQQPASITGTTGAGVTVLVLDTQPTIDQVRTASSSVGNKNTLLQDIVENVTFKYYDLPNSIDDPNSNPVRTGKDIYGALVGFPMEDHGLFVAGIVRDLAPGAKVECIRVLNDFGVGDTVTLASILQDINDRLGKDLQLPLVVNLSLVATPPDESLPVEGFTLDDIQAAREGLLLPLSLLASRGVVFVASAGNDSDPRDTSMQMMMSSTNTPLRMNARYPAAFAGQLENMIPVGAVDKDGKATPYSNYPGSFGIATYGGSTLQSTTPAHVPNTLTQVVEPIDALRGVYSASLYPALSQDDRYPPPLPQPPDYPEYNAPGNADAWAYWSGTSFATPIISALAARILQGQAPNSIDVRATILSSAPAKTTWTHLEPADTDQDGPMFMAEQSCLQSNTSAIG